MQLYNTLTKQKENFTPIDGKTARIYSCGPTVYASASIGNMRAYVFVDILKKSIELAGFKVSDVMNLTDVGHLQSDGDEGEDKIEVAAKKAQITPAEIARRYTDEFFADCERLNIRKPKIIAPATEYIAQMIQHIKGLEAKGYTYVTSDGVYFDSSKFGNYYCLRGEKAKDGDKAGERVALGEKKNANDFALWRLTPPTALQKWDSPWGVGCPGWHIECSAIARDLLGDVFDIHTGGIDHVPIHHTNEIAQSAALTGVNPARFWMHNEFMKVDGRKMSKSLGNVYTVTDLMKKGFSPLSYRYLLLLTHYRAIMNFTEEGLQAAQNAYDNLVRELARHTGPVSTMMIPMDYYRERFSSYIVDDLNTPKAVALIWEMVKQAPNIDIFRLVLEFDEVLSLGLAEAVEKYKLRQSEVVEIPVAVQELAKARQSAKEKKDWATADRLRGEIKALGFDIIDEKGGYKLVAAMPSLQPK